MIQLMFLRFLKILLDKNEMPNCWINTERKDVVILVTGISSHFKRKAFSAEKAMLSSKTVVLCVLYVTMLIYNIASMKMCNLFVWVWQHFQPWYMTYVPMSST